METDVTMPDDPPEKEESSKEAKKRCRTLERFQRAYHERAL